MELDETLNAVPFSVGDVIRRDHKKRTLTLWALGCLLLIAFLLGVGIGAMDIPFKAALAVLAGQLGINLPWDYSTSEAAVLLAIRLPRAVLAMVAGAALAVSGAALQGLFRNPLADPGLIGVSTGAALAAVSFIVLGASISTVLPAALVPYLLPLAAFGGALLVTFVVYRIARRDGYTDVPTLLLAGVAVNAIAGAGLGLLIFASNDQQLRDLNFWLLGSLAGITWERLLPALPFILVPVLLLPRYARPLNALLLGEEDAGHLGFEVERDKRLIVTLAAFAAGASVALTGVIGFVGLVVPHLVRLTLGPDHRVLLPASILLGAAVMLLADLLARTLVLPAELPIGILTSCVGGPFFLWLLVRGRTRIGW